MNYQRLLSHYRCQRGRGKSHYQIGMDSLAKFMAPSMLSSTLMHLALKPLGLHAADFGGPGVLKQLRVSPNEAKPTDILTGGFFVDPLDAKVWSTYREAFREKIQTVMRENEVEGDIVIEPGDPHKVVSQVAADLKSGVVVIGRGVSSDLLGRLRAQAYEIIRRSPCPVLSV